MRRNSPRVAMALAKQIKLLVLDVDGVLTDAGIYYDSRGEISKRFDVQDGLGVVSARKVGLDCAVVTGSLTYCTEKRVRELGIQEYHAGHVAKLDLVTKLARDRELDMSQVAFLGDDWVDASPMRTVGLPLAVINAQPEIKRLALWITSRPGGHGAVRETLRFILRAQGKLDEAFGRWE